MAEAIFGRDVAIRRTLQKEIQERAHPLARGKQAKQQSPNDEADQAHEVNTILVRVTGNPAVNSLV
jgi:hypothetical protein